MAGTGAGTREPGTASGRAQQEPAAAAARPGQQNTTKLCSGRNRRNRRGSRRGSWGLPWAGYSKNRQQEQPTRPEHHKAPQRRSSTPPRHTSATGSQDASHPAPASVSVTARSSVNSVSQPSLGRAHM
ncbi:hypothetical protein NDU88_005954 [Pleurodeles waltl]|uniref:Uncharacterized protein n=1 Tax=Pleurodeles waltl TaxID=8319 RepID=A0AAV7TYU7_PLEWA|nr:hypothetical protein NDU88_005954 [Pleurodeles waltl]